MLDMKLFRESPELVIASQQKRGKSVDLVHDVIKYDKLWRDAVQKTDKLKQERNRVSLEIPALKKSGKPVDAKIAEMRKISEEIAANDKIIEEFMKKRDEARYGVGNMLHESVPEGLEAKVVRVYGEKPKYSFKPKSHVDLLESLDLADLDRAAKVSGARFYYLKNELVLLNFALQRFAFDLLMKRGFTPMLTPFMLSREAMKGVSELSDFEETLYTVGEDHFLIATSEQTLIAQHMGEAIPAEKLPIKYVGFSTNFRREAGAHGKDTKGIFRTHQFDKIEQIVICRPEDSLKLHEELIRNAEEIYQKLGLHYHVVNIAAQDMNDNAAKKYDLEAWMPAQETFRELVSGSNCTDYQARKLDIRCVTPSGEREHVHILNCTGIATERTITAILENFQNADGTVNVPKTLWPYMGGIKKICAKKSFVGAEKKAVKKAGKKKK